MRWTAWDTIAPESSLNVENETGLTRLKIGDTSNVPAREDKPTVTPPNAAVAPPDEPAKSPNHSPGRDSNVQAPALRLDGHYFTGL